MAFAARIRSRCGSYLKLVQRMAPIHANSVCRRLHDQPLIFRLQRLTTFGVSGVDGNTSHGADLLALRLVEMSDALGAFIGIDLIDQRPHEDGLIGAFRLTDVAVDAIVGNHQRHDRLSGLNSFQRLYLPRFFSAAIFRLKEKRISIHRHPEQQFHERWCRK